MNIRLKSLSQPNLSKNNGKNNLPSDLSSQSSLSSFSSSLNDVSSGVSFGGKFADVNKVLDSVNIEIGSKAKRIFIEKINQASLKSNQTGLAFDEQTQSISFRSPSIFKKTADLLVYPITGFPLDIVNATIGKLREVPGLNKLKALESIQNISFLKNRRINAKNVANVSAIENYFIAYEKYQVQLEKAITPEAKLQVKKDFVATILKDSSAIFDPEKGNYDSTVERAVTRGVTGIIPAFFLANDAYNLSIYMNNDKDAAKEAKQKRFNQEIARIALTAGATFGVMKLFSKSSNGSASITAGIIAGVTLASEAIGRILAGNPVLPVSVEQAKEYADKRLKLKNKHDQLVSGKASESQSKIENLTKDNVEQDVSKKTKKKEGLLILSNFFKGAGALVVFGLAHDKITNIPKVKKFFNKLIFEKYDSFLKEDKVISVSEFNKMLDSIKGNNPDDDLAGIAKKYEDVKNKILKTGNLSAKDKKRLDEELEVIAKNELQSDLSTQTKPYVEGKFGEEQIKARKATIDVEQVKSKLGIKTDDSIIHLGQVERKFRTTVVHEVLLFPARFAWAAIMAPYSKIVKPLSGYIAGSTPKKEKEDAIIKSLRNVVDYYLKNKEKPEFSEQFGRKIFGSLNTETKSGISNANLSSIVKNVSSAVTSAFLIADNYNMVMIDSQGKNKNFAGEKAKERTIQRFVRLMYGAFIIKLFNNVFMKTYHGSLLGAQTVNTAQVALTETLERTSVGLPIGQSTKDEILDKEAKNHEVKGIKGSYFRFMAKLTGKKSISEKG